MKEFWIYTLMRLGLFVGSFALIFGVWFLVTEDVPLFWVILIAFVVSGVASYVLLERQRAAFASKVQGRAELATQRFEEQRSKEDSD
ncbi:DUF4229 domain-containing protein [Nocardioides stalactiti]|uniref:DUF4229 domain-containing protein n=1 Tax=Nocardioides stalactiti TaxID=2755356 RepID=UPI00160420F3|nr:DUF4229 domain-containing protein [Nocardioides stalactiti]